MDHLQKRRVLVSRYANFSQNNKSTQIEILVFAIVSGAQTGYLFAWAMSLRDPSLFWWYSIPSLLAGCFLSRVLYYRTYFKTMEREALGIPDVDPRLGKFERTVKLITAQRPDFVSSIVRMTGIIAGILIAYDCVDFGDRSLEYAQDKIAQLEQQISETRSESERLISEERASFDERISFYREQIQFYTDRQEIRLRALPLQKTVDELFKDRAVKIETLITKRDARIDSLESLRAEVSLAAVSSNQNTAALKFLSGKNETIYKVLVMIIAAIIVIAWDSGQVTVYQIKAVSDYNRALEALASSSGETDTKSAPVKGETSVNSSVKSSVKNEVNKWVKMGLEKKIKMINHKIDREDPLILRAYNMLKSGAYTQDQIAEAIGKSRAWISYIKSAYQRRGESFEPQV